GSCRFLSPSDIADAKELPPGQRIVGDHAARGSPGSLVAQIHPPASPTVAARGEPARGATHAAHRERVVMVRQVDPGGAP
ncbi:MAG TPA: hypothetical protein VN327_12435, partial [Pseudonocardiaceae bacterium]|nr:hypothetical protein [Pseudonocardiaceae bacterium]